MHSVKMPDGCKSLLLYIKTCPRAFFFFFSSFISFSSCLNQHAGSTAGQMQLTTPSAERNKQTNKKSFMVRLTFGVSKILKRISLLESISSPFLSSFI